MNTIYQNHNQGTRYHISYQTPQEYNKRVCGDFGWVGLLVVRFLHKINANPLKNYLLGKSGPNATFDLNFLGLGWPWVGEFVGFMIIFTCFPSQQKLVNRRHRID